MLFLSLGLAFSDLLIRPIPAVVAYYTVPHWWIILCVGYTILEFLLIVASWIYRNVFTAFICVLGVVIWTFNRPGTPHHNGEGPMPG
jgi:hypothetical protein